MGDSLGMRIRELRNNKKLSQKEFGKLFALAESTIGMYERDERKPDYDTLLKLSDYFGVSTDFLLTGKPTGQLAMDLENPQNIIESREQVRFPIRLKKVMEDKGISVEKIAKEIDLSDEKFIQKYLTSPAIMPFDEDTLKIISLITGVPSDYLLGRTNLDKSANPVTVAGQEISLSQEELKLFEELKKHPVLFHDLATDPERKIRELLKLYEMKKMLLEEDDVEYGDGFGELKD